MDQFETGRYEFVDSEELQVWIKSGFLWLDFYSIPQINQGNQHGHGLDKVNKDRNETDGLYVSTGVP